MTNDAKLEELGKRPEGNNPIETLQEKSYYILRDWGIKRWANRAAGRRCRRNDNEPVEPLEPLEAMLDRLIPPDETPGATAFELGPRVRRSVPDLDLLLERMSGFAALTVEEQNAVLRTLDREGDPVFATLVVTVHELYYADPRSWPSLGYTTHLQGRP
jgi:hypothetical protein